MHQCPALQEQIREGALIGRSSGWDTAASFGNVDAEYEAATNGCALADLSMFGRVEVKGADRLDLLHRISTNDIAGARPGDVRSTIFVTDKGRIIDRVLLIVREQTLLMVTSPGIEDDVIRWVAKYIITEDITLSNVTDSTAMFCIVGPAEKSLDDRLHLSALLPNSWTVWPAGGEEGIVALVRAERYQFALVTSAAREAGKVWRLLSEKRAEGAIRPIGSIAYEAYRITAGIPARPGELAETRTPYDAGLREDISFTKGCYIGQEVIARLDTYQKIRRRLSGVVFSDAPGPAGQALLKGEKEVGELTSALADRVKGRFLGLAVVTDADASAGEAVTAAESHARGSLTDLPIVAAAA